MTRTYCVHFRDEECAECDAEAEAVRAAYVAERRAEVDAAVTADRRRIAERLDAEIAGERSYEWPSTYQGDLSAARRWAFALARDVVQNVEPTPGAPTEEKP